ncbi:MAG: penicillin-binding protein 2, partial [Nitrospirae bacterium]
PRATARRLAPILHRPVDYLVRRLRSRRPFVWLARRLPPPARRRVEALGLPGILCRAEPGRYYPRGPDFRSVVGLVGVDEQDLEGLEVAYDRRLRGRPGLYLWLRDGHGRPVVERLVRPARPGRDLRLALDEVVQHIAHEALARGVARAGARGGVALVLDPATGELLAMADAGNPGGVKPDAGRRYRSYAVTWQFEPGSMFKPAVVAALLEAGKVTPGTLVFGEHGAYRVADRTYHEASGHRFGWLSCAQVLQRSSNIGMVKLSERIEPEPLYRALTRYGFGRRTGIDYPGEARGSLAPPRRWSGVSRASISIGQEVLVTALQIAAFYGALANGGLWRPPHLARGAAWAGRDAPRPRRILSPATCRKLVRILEGVVGPHGTAPKAKVEGFRVAGKTGTAQQIDPRTHRYSRSRYVSSFVGIVPAEAPRLVILVSLDAPRGGAYGGQVAAPIFREIATATLRHLGVEPPPGPRVLVAAAPRRPPRL